MVSVGDFETKIIIKYGYNEMNDNGQNQGCSVSYTQMATAEQFQKNTLFTPSSNLLRLISLLLPLILRGI